MIVFSFFSKMTIDPDLYNSYIYRCNKIRMVLFPRRERSSDTFSYCYYFENGISFLSLGHSGAVLSVCVRVCA